MPEGEIIARRPSQWLEMKNLHPLSQENPDLKQLLTVDYDKDQEYTKTTATQIINKQYKEQTLSFSWQWSTIYHK
jgi:hypothetical protein